MRRQNNMKEMRNFFNRNWVSLLVYTLSLLPPLLVIVPPLLQRITITSLNWAIGGSIAGVVVAVWVIVTTVDAEKRRLVLLAVIVIGLVVGALILATYKLPKYSVPHIFFYCYYALDLLAIIASALIAKFSPKQKRRVYQPQQHTPQQTPSQQHTPQQAPSQQ